MFGTHPGEQLAGYQGERRLEALFLSLTCRGLFVFFFRRYFFVPRFYRVCFLPACRQMCNTNMSVSTDGAVSTSQIPASEQETLVGILIASVTSGRCVRSWWTGLMVWR